MLRKSLYTLLAGLGLHLLCFNLYATNYTSKAAGGDWETNGTWEGGTAPGTTLADGDSVFIAADSDVTYSNELTINGVLTIYAGGSLKGYSNNLKIGGGSNTGECYNYGTIHARKVEIKGVDKTPVSGLPLLHNHDTIRTGKIHSGTNSEAGTASSGKTINATTGYILISATLGEAKGELHIDGEFENCGTIEAETKFKPHGSDVSCCGAIYTPLVEFDLNKDRQASLGCINVCSASGSSTEPTWRVNGGSDYASLSAFTDDNGSGSAGFHTGTDFSIDSANTFACGTSLSGNTWGGIGSYPLPVELIDFVVEPQENKILISWSTATEVNSDYFEVERKTESTDWQPIAKLTAMGYSNQTQFYSWADYSKVSGTVYYRLKQVDKDGSVTLFPAKGITLYQSSESGEITLFPNPNQGNFRLTGPLDDLQELVILDAQGKEYPVEFTRTNDEVVVDLAHFPTGIVQLELRFSNHTEHLGMVINE